MKFVPRIHLFLMLVCAACSGPQRTTPENLEPVAVGIGTLIIEVDGLRSSDGSVNVSVFRSSEGFPQDTKNVYRSAVIELSDDENPVFRFDNLSYGHYSISMLHDANSNGELDTGLLGVPTEGFGFSNNPISALIEPPLTTVNQPAFEMGKTAAGLMLKQLENEDEPFLPVTEILKTELIVRKST